MLVFEDFRPYFPAFILSTEIFSVSLLTKSQCGKKRTTKTPNADTFYTVKIINSPGIMLLFCFTLFMTTCKGNNIIAVLQRLSKFPGKHMIYFYFIKTSPSNLRKKTSLQVLSETLAVFCFLRSLSN